MVPHPTPQGVHCPTFNPPPPDHGLSVPGLYEYQAKHSPDHPMYTYAHPDGGSIHNITFAEAWGQIRIVADVVSRRCSKPKTPAGDRPVVGVLAMSDAISYVYVLVALMSLGYTPMPMAPTNSADAVVHLLEAKSATHLFVSEDEDVQATVQKAKAMLDEKGVALELLPMVIPADYTDRAAPLSAPRDMVRNTINEAAAIILHSSGSTGLPKPIPMTDRALVDACDIPYFGDIDLAGKCIATHTNPPCHVSGLFAMTWPLACGVICALYPPVQPLIVPTAANFLAAWQACKCDIVMCMPVFIEALARDPANLPALKALEFVVYMGASMTKSVGDRLVEEGVRLLSLWGSTEVGAATKALPQEPMPKEDWEYFEFAPNVKFYMKPQDGAERVFEPIKPVTETSYPNITNTELDGRPAWAMGDLLEQHPEIPTRWKVLGRQDDQLVFSTGEMLNPVPIEDMLAQDAHVGSALIFGDGHVEPGLLVEPSDEHRDGLSGGDKRRVEEYKDLIWPAVEKANAKIQEYQIRREMILIASPEKPFQHTPKGTTRRGVCLKLYGEEIDELYAAKSDESPEKREFRGRM